GCGEEGWAGGGSGGNGASKAAAASPATTPKATAVSTSPTGAAAAISSVAEPVNAAKSPDRSAVKTNCPERPGFCRHSQRCCGDNGDGCRQDKVTYHLTTPQLPPRSAPCSGVALITRPLGGAACSDDCGASNHERWLRAVVMMRRDPGSSLELQSSMGRESQACVGLVGPLAVRSAND